MKAARLRRVLVTVTASVVAASGSWWGFSTRWAGAEPNPIGEGLVAVVPYRVLDTRQPGSTALDANTVRTVPIAGVGVVPANASGVIVNVTAVNATTPGSYLTLFPDGAPRPEVSTLNPQVGGVVFNSATVRLGAGSLAIYNFVGRVDVIVDVTGYTVPIPPSANGGSRAYWTALDFIGPDPYFLTSTPHQYAMLAIPPGNYVVQAKITIAALAPGQVNATCELRAGSKTLDSSSIGQGGPVQLMFADAVPDGQIGLYCSAAAGLVAPMRWVMIASSVDSVQRQGCPVPSILPTCPV